MGEPCPTGSHPNIPRNTVFPAKSCSRNPYVSPTIIAFSAHRAAGHRSRRPVLRARQSCFDPTLGRGSKFLWLPGNTANEKAPTNRLGFAGATMGSDLLDQDRFLAMMSATRPISTRLVRLDFSVLAKVFFSCVPVNPVRLASFTVLVGTMMKLESNPSPGRAAKLFSFIDSLAISATLGFVPISI